VAFGDLVGEHGAAVLIAWPVHAKAPRVLERALPPAVLKEA
jgi:hypothetical protein